ncbi:MAG: hypothetical protein H7070_13590 [Saprospiraceae bacterium]|nr:hypothetical protein [Pyrinomonadaceae bacterium]
MGYIDTSEKLPIFYNVVQAVGKNCPNKRDDVMLIQYLLDWRYKNCQPRGAVPKGVIKVDGIYGGITQNWILKFQLDIMLSGGSIQADNRVDRIRDKESFCGSVSQMCYTLCWLNWIVADEEHEAFAKTGLFVPLQNPHSVPPPSNDMVIPAAPMMIPAVGGL